MRRFSLSWKALAEVAQHLAGAVVARRAGDAAAGMGAGAAQVQALQRSAIVGVSEHRPRRPQLIERKLAVEDVAADQAEIALEVGGGKRAVRDHAAAESRRMRLDHVEDALDRFALARGPVGIRREVLAE